MNVFKIIPTATGTTGCALVAANKVEEAINTYTGSAMYRYRFYKEGGCKTDIIASLICETKHSCVLFDCIKL